MTETRLEHRVYTLIQREDDSPYWFQIGRAFPHKDGSGSTIRLNAMPVSPKLVIRHIDPDAGEQQASLPMDEPEMKEPAKSAPAKAAKTARQSVKA